jgi:hypothetical protein
MQGRGGSRGSILASRLGRLGAIFSGLGSERRFEIHNIIDFSLPHRVKLDVFVHPRVVVFFGGAYTRRR